MKIALIHDPIKKASKHDTEIAVISEHRKDILVGVEKALLESGHKVILIEADDDLPRKLSSRIFDIAFNISVGDKGEWKQSYVPIVLERLGLPFTGSSSMTHMLALDKGIAKKIFQAESVDTPQFQVFSTSEIGILNSNLSYPVFIKPSRGGCSLGISDRSIVENKNDLQQLVKSLIKTYNQPVIAEEYLSGREFTVGIVGNENPTVLSLLEIDFTDSQNINFRTFDNKMLGSNKVKSICPALISDDLRDKIKSLAIKAYNALSCRDFARIDIRCDKNGIPLVLEINTLPGLAPKFGSFSQMAKSDGISYNKLVNLILDFASIRYGLK